MHRTQPGHVNSALLIVDMISDFLFPEGEALVRQARSIVKPISLLAARFRRSGWPVVYVNDNFGQWHLSFPELVRWVQRGESLGREIAAAIAPVDSDYFILKPRHSAFYETALPSLLRTLDTHRLALVGLAGDACVLATAMDAHMREMAVWIPADATASLTQQRNRRALDFLHESMQCDIRTVSQFLSELRHDELTNI
ncbi:MAG TPA: isochorismatase family cysteine hydrolase [Dyella sp.]|uniref:cysteine hydrolase family protein n=1 Tax=Dyella sp. TaxID=1869338 RepID=UPI002F95DD54